MAIAGPGSESGPTYTVYDPQVGENVTVGSEYVTGTAGSGYYAELVGSGGVTDTGTYEYEYGSDNKNWFQNVISGGKRVLSSALGLIPGINIKTTQGTETQSEEKEEGENEEDKVFAGMTSEQLVLLAGGAGLIYYLSQNS